MQAPDRVPEEWVAHYRVELRGRRHHLLTEELARIERASRRDTSILLAANSPCAILLAGALSWAGMIARSTGALVTVTVAVLAAFSTCVWLVHRSGAAGRRWVG
jgi:cytochrome c-type biogenesis protein CcmH/NrfG